MALFCQKASPEQKGLRPILIDLASFNSRHKASPEQGSREVIYGLSLNGTVSMLRQKAVAGFIGSIDSWSAKVCNIAARRGLLNPCFNGPVS